MSDERDPTVTEQRAGAPPPVEAGEREPHDAAAAAEEKGGRTSSRLRLYNHWATPQAARTILARGFRDDCGNYPGTSNHKGVWLAAGPTEAGSGPGGLQLRCMIGRNAGGHRALLRVAIDLTDDECDGFEQVDNPGVPASG